jgi:hypothetical protein
LNHVMSISFQMEMAMIILENSILKNEKLHIILTYFLKYSYF